ncbi:MAG: DUF802 domain-containing protein [Hahellaceae bacterium]|nr:DUF802 domain-containing protein [Hahellaceae bacterium]MCP5209595.1 DUF802 domain-containing protein [Hahellaceae bacterium]
MTRLIFSAAFLLGAAAIGWMGTNFIDANRLGLIVIVVIGIVYSIGVVELLQFQRATGTLSRALAALVKSDASVSPELQQWLDQLHHSLRSPVRLRIEGERIGLPTPVITPYLVGLLVMLGLLGTFVGMVDTLQGAVIALEATDKLEAIRAGLTAPIGGLSLAFGTSVAGVAASAMLGLMSTLSRRERLLATRLLDTKISSSFRDFSLAHNRQEAYRALQMQSQGLPQITEKLDRLVTQMERMSAQLGDTLVTNQNAFHASALDNFGTLATSVAQSLQDSLSECGRLTGESLRPVVQEVMTDMQAHLRQSTETTHANLTNVMQSQLATVQAQFIDTTKDVSEAWGEGLQAQQQSNEQLLQHIGQTFESFSGQFESTAKEISTTLSHTTNGWLEQQRTDDLRRLDMWSHSLEQLQKTSSESNAEALTAIVQAMKQRADAQEQTFKEMTAQWQQTSESSLAQQRTITERLEKTAADIATNAQVSSRQMLDELHGLLKSSDTLIRQRITSESQWLAQHGERMDYLTSTLQTELTSLRDVEAQRGAEAIDRLAKLEGIVTEHLRTLGCALEEPMTRLIQTASETPRAAAEVIGHLRNEISNNIERDNKLLAERQSLMQALQALSASMGESSSGQLLAVEKLVESSAELLQRVGASFKEQVHDEMARVADVADQFAGSTAEMSSLGDAFGLAVAMFNESNQTLVDSLNRIENALTQSTARSDEQLSYYVAQAREVIDHSLMSQRELFDSIRELSAGKRDAEVTRVKAPAEVC